MMQNSGKVTKPYITGKRNNQWDSNVRASGQKIDQLFAELPKIPNTEQQNKPSFNSPTNNFPKSQMNLQHLQQPPQYYNMQPRPQLQQQYYNNNMDLNFHAPSTFNNTQYPYASQQVSQQQLMYTSPYHQPFQRNINMLPGASGGVNQLNQNTGNNSGPISINYYGLNNERNNPYISPQKPNATENKLTMNSSQPTSKENNVKNEKEKLPTTKVKPMQRAQTPTLNKTAASDSWRNSNISGNQFSMSGGEGSTNNSSLKLNDNLPCNRGKTKSPLATPASNNSTLALNSTAAAVSSKKNNSTNAKANIGKLNSGNSSSASSSSGTNRTVTPSGVTASMSKNDSANTSTSNKTGAPTVKETNAEAPKRNVGLFRNISDSNYSTVSGVNSSKTTGTLGATANVNSSLKAHAVNISTSNNTATVTAKETNVEAPKRNVGLFRNISDSNYSTVSGVNSSKTTETLGAIAYVNSSSKSHAVNISTSKNTAAITAKETSATAPKRNIGLFGNSDSNYSTVTPLSAPIVATSSVNTNRTTATLNGRGINNPVYELRARPVERNFRKPQQDSKCCIS